MYYYRYQSGKDSGHLCLGEPLDLEKLEGYTQITKEEYEAEKVSSNSVPQENFQIMRQIGELKSQLKETDWIACKIAEADTQEEAFALRTKYAQEIFNRRQIRAQINELEEQL